MHISYSLWGVTEQFLPNTEGSTSVLMQQSMLQSFNPLRNASAQNKDGVCQFSPTRATNRLPHQRPLSEPSQFEYTVIKPTNRSTIAESLVKITLQTLVKTMQRCIFLHMYIHPLSANLPQHLNDLLH